MDEIKYISRLDPGFPEKLKNIPLPPAGIYYTGELPAEDEKSVAIVGSRNCSQYGREIAEYFASYLAKQGVQVISGLARGIDGISQRAAASAGGKTFGVLGTGIDVVYPRENRAIFEQVKASGGLISEYPPGTTPLKPYFAERNRLISGLADLLLVIEAKVMSGTSITVRCALEQGRDVYAVPGRLTDPLSAGCNRLIAQGAGTALSPEDVILALKDGSERPRITPGFEPAGEVPPGDEKKMTLDGMEKIVYSTLDLYPKTLGEIAREGKIPLGEAMEALISLTIRGFAGECGKNNYVRM